MITSANPSAPPAAPARLLGRARALALQTVAEIRAEWAAAGDLVARLVRTERGLSSRDRRLLVDTVFELVRFDRRLDAIIDECVVSARGGRGEAARGLRKELTPIVRDELKLLVHELRTGVAPEGPLHEMAKRVGRAPDPAVVCADDAGLARFSGNEREAVRRSFPGWMFEHFVTDLGLTEACALGDALNRRAPLGLLVNQARITRAALQEELRALGIAATLTPLALAGLSVDTHVNVGGLPAFRDGLFDVMEEGSQLIAEIVAPGPDARVADVCAGAGGKTLALAGALGGRGRILALDTSGKKLEELRRRARRAGYSNLLAREVTGASLPPEAVPGGWDRVLVDAPCSAVGTLRRHPELRWTLTPTRIKELANAQLSLLGTYAALVAPGGWLIHATCTVFHAENQGVVDRFLADRPEFELHPLALVVGETRARAIGDGKILRVLPSSHGTDGFFAAVLRRRA